MLLQQFLNYWTFYSNFIRQRVRGRYPLLCVNSNSLALSSVTPNRLLFKSAPTRTSLRHVVRREECFSSSSLTIGHSTPTSYDNGIVVDILYCVLIQTVEHSRPSHQPAYCSCQHRQGLHCITLLEGTSASPAVFELLDILLQLHTTTGSRSKTFTA